MDSPNLTTAPNGPQCVDLYCPPPLTPRLYPRHTPGEGYRVERDTTVPSDSFSAEDTPLSDTESLEEDPRGTPTKSNTETLLPPP